MAQMANINETSFMAEPTNSARHSALIKFVAMYESAILELLAVPYFPALFKLDGTRPLIFHIHLSYHPEQIGITSQLKMVFARHTTRAELEAFHAQRGGVDVDWDQFVGESAGKRLVLGPEGRKDALITIRFTARGPGSALSYGNMLYHRTVWSRSGLDPVNLDLDWESALKHLLRMFGTKKSLGFWTNAVVYAKNPEWMGRAEGAFADASTGEKDAFRRVATELNSSGIAVLPAALYYATEVVGWLSSDESEA
ncbi:hypothetical protein RQP46_002003 [Phenoliferia psychrophenolica]